MKDLVFGNNNKMVTRSLSDRYFKANRKQNKVLIFSIVLVTFMMFTIFSVGISFYQNYQEMNLHLRGTRADGLIADLSEEQELTLSRLAYVSPAGNQIFSGIAKTDEGKQITLTYYDDAEWRNNIADTVEDIQGHLPEKERELMLSEDVLHALGITSPTLGMEISLPVKSDGTIDLEDFVLCGWYGDFVSLSRQGAGINGNTAAAQMAGIRPDANAIVSPAYAETHEICRITSFHVEQNHHSLSRNLQRDLGLSETQTVVAAGSPSNHLQGGGYAVAGAALCGLFVMLCGYLLIYNIAYISVAKDIRFYGMLKTLGTTPRQLKQIVRRQILRLSCMGIPGGLVLGSVVSIIIVPACLESMLSSGGLQGIISCEPSFSPLIYLAAAAFSLATVVLSCRKPAREAGKVSPIAAVRYSPVKQTGKQIRSKGSYGTRLHRMAFRNVFRDRKKAVLVFLSLFMGMTIFVVIFTLFSHPDWEVKSVVDTPYDFDLGDETLTKITDPKEGVFTPEFMKEIHDMEGITEQEIVYGCASRLDASDGIWGEYVRDKGEFSSAAPDDLREEIRACVGGISENLLQKMPLAEGSYDAQAMESFENGTAIYLSPTDMGNIPENMIGKSVEIESPVTGQKASYKVAGILKNLTLDQWKPGEIFYNSINAVRERQIGTDYYRHKIGDIYMSETGIRKLEKEPVIGQILLNADPEQEQWVNQQLTELAGGNQDIYLLAKSTFMEMNKTSIGSILLFGAVFSLLLLVIGLMNFVNTMTTTIYGRKAELTALESIGMTKKQMEKMLSLEGGIYAAFSMLLLIAIGLPLTYGIVQLLREEFYFMTFQPPVALIGLTAVLTGVICVTVPVRTYRQIAKESIARRLSMDM